MKAALFVVHLTSKRRHLTKPYRYIGMGEAIQQLSQEHEEGSRAQPEGPGLQGPTVFDNLSTCDGLPILRLFATRLSTIVQHFDVNRDC